MLKKNFKKRSEGLGDNSQLPKAGGGPTCPLLWLWELMASIPLAAFYPHSLWVLELPDALGAFVYFAFPGCFVMFFWSFPSGFFGGQVLVSLDAAGQSFPSWNQTL